MEFINKYIVKEKKRLIVFFEGRFVSCPGGEANYVCSCIFISSIYRKKNKINFGFDHLFKKDFFNKICAVKNYKLPH